MRPRWRAHIGFNFSEHRWASPALFLTSAPAVDRSPEQVRRKHVSYWSGRNALKIQLRQLGNYLQFLMEPLSPANGIHERVSPAENEKD